MITTEWDYPMLLLGSLECCLARLSNSFLDYRYSITSLQLWACINVVNNRNLCTVK